MKVPQAFEARAVPSLMWEKDREIQRDIQRGREADAPSQLPGNSPRGMDLGGGRGAIPLGSKSCSLIRLALGQHCTCLPSSRKSEKRKRKSS